MPTKNLSDLSKSELNVSTEDAGTPETRSNPVGRRQRMVLALDAVADFLGHWKLQYLLPSNTEEKEVLSARTSGARVLPPILRWRKHKALKEAGRVRSIPETSETAPSSSVLKTTTDTVDIF